MIADIPTKYGFDINMTIVQKTIMRLTNQIWKLIPMRENGEDWQKQLDTVILEIAGLNEIFVQDPRFLQLLAKLEGVKFITSIDDFPIYRKTVFEVIALLQELIK